MSKSRDTSPDLRWLSRPLKDERDVTADDKRDQQGERRAARSSMASDMGSDNTNEASLQKEVAQQKDLADPSPCGSSAPTTDAPASHPHTVSDTEVEDTKDILVESVCYLSARARNALKLLNISALDEFLRADLTGVLCLQGFGEGTYNELKKKQCNIGNTLGSVTIPESSAFRGTYPKGQGADDSLPLEAECPLRLKERNALHLLGVRTLEEFLQADLLQVPYLPQMGETTYRGLRAKQLQLRECHHPSSDAPNAADVPVWDVSDLGRRERVVLRRLGVKTIRDFLRLNLRHARKQKGCGQTVYRRLVQEQLDLAEKYTAEMEGDCFRC